MCINNSRNNMFSVMSNTGFSGVTYKKPNGLVFTLPPKAIHPDTGVIKPMWMKRLKDTTVEAAYWLADRGATVTMAR